MTDGSVKRYSLCSQTLSNALGYKIEIVSAAEGRGKKVRGKLTAFDEMARVLTVEVDNVLRVFHLDDIRIFFRQDEIFNRKEKKDSFDDAQKQPACRSGDNKGGCCGKK